MKSSPLLLTLLMLAVIPVIAQNKHIRNQNNFEKNKIEKNKLKYSDIKIFKDVKELNSFCKSEELFAYTKPETEFSSGNWDKDKIFKGYKQEDEVISMRDRTSKHFSNSDGTISAFLFSGTSIHYYENGIWKDINNNITLNKTQTRNDYKYSNTENIFKSFFPDKSGNQGIKVDLKEGSVKEWIDPEFCWFDENGAIGDPLKANDSDGFLNNNKITYKSVFPYTDVQFTQSNDGRKMDIIIQDKSALSNIPSNATGLAYSETIIIPESWTIKTIKGKDDFTHKEEIQQISVFDETGFEIFKYDLPIVYENKIQKKKITTHNTIEEKGNSSIQAYYKIEQNGNFIKIWTITPKEWLLNEEREFPIIVDPTTTYYPQNASYWTGRILNSGTTKSDTYLRVRGGANGRGWAKFDISSITDGSTINDVDMTYYKYNDDGTGPYIDVYQLSSDPVPSNAASIWTDCADGNQYCNNLYEYSYGSHTTDLGTNADTDLHNQLSSDWFGIGTLADDTYSYWEYWYGYNNANSIYITVTYTIPSCTSPSSVYASNITYNSATLNWTTPTPAPTNGYEYYYSTSSTPPSGSGTSNSNTDVDLSSLSAATTYYVWVRSDCGGGDYSSWTTMYQFTTNAAPCNITSLNFVGSSRTPTLDGGYYYFDVCRDETLTLQANATCTNCGSGTNYNWVINAYDGNGETDYSSNPLDYDIDYASGYDALLEVEGDACYISYPIRFRSSDGPIVNSVSASINGCSGDFQSIVIGSAGSDVEVTDYHGEVSQTLGVGAETFIPDGPSCTTQCYESSVTFTDFAPGSTITSADDILYLAINMEHTFIGDMQITLEGPGGCGSAMILPDRYTIAQGGLDDETYAWPWTFVGFYCNSVFEGYGRLDGGVWYTTMDFDDITVFETLAEADAAAVTYPLGFSCTSQTYNTFVAKVAMGVPNTDDLDTSTDPCDGTEWYNDSGTGWDYCWSNNTSYSYAPTTNSYIYETGNVEYYDAAEASYEFMRVNPSDESAGTNFYHPYEDFYTELAGCPLNGTWTIKVCDSWAADNGWIFEWSLALDPSLLPVSWDYDVSLDYADWSAITDADFDFVTGTPLTYDLIPVPDLSTGTYGGTFTVYDEYGCGSDAIINFNVTGLPTIPGLEDGDYVWIGFEGTNWDANVHNWFVYDEDEGFEYASIFPPLNKNVHIINYCSNPNPTINNAEAFCDNLNIYSGKALTMSSTFHQQINITGDWNNEGTFNAGIGTVNFSGDNTQEINTNTTGGETFYNLSLNKDSGTILNAHNDVTVSNELDLSSGILNTNSNTVYMTNINSNALVSGNTTGNDGYILGALQRATDGSSTYTFPIGYTGYDAQGFDIKTTGASGSDILGLLEPYSFAPLQTFAYCDLEVDPGLGYHTIGDGNPGYDGIPDQISLDLNSPLQWDITNPGGGITSYDVTVYPSGAQMLSSITSANGLNVYYLMKNGEPGNAGCTVDDEMPWFSQNGFIKCPTQNSLSGLNSFSKFNLIGASGAGSILPVELTHFDAIYNGKFVELKWSTASELNSDLFLVERSDDALSFNPVGKVISLAPNGNSSYEINYHFYDKDVLSDTYYYRLKQYDLDGSYDYSNIATVIISENGVFTINPNPARDVVEIEYYCSTDDTPIIKIYDDRGRLVHMDKLVCFKGQNLSSIDISHYAPGMYMFILTSSSGTNRAKLIKQ